MSERRTQRSYREATHAWNTSEINSPHTGFTYSFTACLICEERVDTNTLFHEAVTDLKDYTLLQNTKWYLAGLATGAPHWCRVTEAVTVGKIHVLIVNLLPFSESESL